MRSTSETNAAALLGIRADSIGELDRVVQRGLPKASLARLYRYLELASRSMAWSEFQQMIVPRATWKRREKLLSTLESAKIERLARVVAMAIKTWDGNQADAREWLWTPHPELDNRPPVLVAMTELGARRVEQVLAGITYGLPV
jgi:putative toxin-antitoxin system antitoxin component (TIGR02293 family)